MRGNASQHSHAAAMGGRPCFRASSLTRNSAPRHSRRPRPHRRAVDAPDTLGKMLGPEAFQKLREERGLEHDGLLVPAEIAETYFHLAHQHRSAWTHELDLRAFSDLPWWNH